MDHRRRNRYEEIYRHDIDSNERIGLLHWSVRSLEKHPKRGSPAAKKIFKHYCFFQVAPYYGGAVACSFGA
jgi:hypothetical protein